MADAELLERVHGLSDLELAVLLCLVSREHCLISTPEDAVDRLVEELQQIASRTFGLTYAVVNCTPHTTLEDFATSLLLTSNHNHNHNPASSPGAPSSGSPFSRPRSNNNTANANNDYFLQQQQLSGRSPRTVSSAAFSSSPSYLHHAHAHTHTHTHGNGSSSTGIGIGTGTGHAPRIANVVLAKNLDRAPAAVQIQALELLRTRRIFTRAAVQPAPRPFLLVAVTAAEADARGPAPVTPHLNDFLCLSHWHDPDDGFANLEELEEEGEEEGDEGDEDDDDAGTAKGNNDDDGGTLDDDGGSSEKGLFDFTLPIDVETASTESVVKKSEPGSTSNGGNNTRHHHHHQHHHYHHPYHHHQQLSPQPPLPQPPPPPSLPPPVISEPDIATLAKQAQQAQSQADVDVLRYALNVVSFLRVHRAVAAGGGATPAATKHLERLAACLAPLHGLDFVTPALVALAARKVYAHRVRLVSPPSSSVSVSSTSTSKMGTGAGIERERSLQWGSEPAAVAALLDGVRPEDVIEDVLGTVPPPV